MTIEQWVVTLAGPVMILWALALWFGWLPAGNARKARVWHQMYDNPEHPHHKTFPVAPILLGGIGTIAIAISVAMQGESPPSNLYFAIPFLLSLVAYGMAIRFWFRPPKWSIPRWLQEELQRRDAGQPSLLPLPPGGKRLTITRRELIAGWMLAGVATAGVTLWGWPPAILFGVGTWVSLVAIAKVSDD